MFVEPRSMFVEPKAILEFDLAQNNFLDIILAPVASCRSSIVCYCLVKCQHPS